MIFFLDYLVRHLYVAVVMQINYYYYYYFCGRRLRITWRDTGNEGHQSDECDVGWNLPNSNGQTGVETGPTSVLVTGRTKVPG